MPTPTEPTAPPSPEPGSVPDRMRLRGLLLALATLLLVFEAGRAPLLEPDEGRYAEIPREMLASGDFVTPRLNGVRYFEKPPLLYWSVALSFRLFGESETAARLPVKLAALGLVAATFLFARRRFGERTALLSAFIVASSLLVSGLARNLLIDPLLALAVTGTVFALAAFAEHDEQGNAGGVSRARWLVAVSAAAGVLLKGPVALLLPGVPFLVFLVLTGRLRSATRLLAPAPLLAFLLATVPWHVLVALRNPGFVDFYVWDQHVLRFLTSRHERTGSPLYFVAVLLAGLLPWTAFLGRMKEVWPGRSRSAWRSSGATGYLFLFVAFTFLFFSVSKSKLIPYVLPAWPALGVLLGAGIDRAAARGARLRADTVGAGLLLAALFAAGAAFGLGQGWLARVDAVAGGAVLLAGLALGAALLLGPFGRSLPVEVRVGGPWLLVLAGAVVAWPSAARTLTPWPVLEHLRGTTAPVVQYHDYFRVVSFYAGRTTLVVDPGDEELQFDASRGAATPGRISEGEFERLLKDGRRPISVVARTGAVPDLLRRMEGGTVHVTRDRADRFALLERTPLSSGAPALLAGGSPPRPRREGSLVPAAHP